MSISAGYGASSLEPEPSYLPPLWTSHTDPEGSRYFVQDSEPRLITPTNVYVPENAERLQHWLKHVQALLITRRITINSSIELYLRLDDEGDCCYYLVDHNSHKEFWLQDLDTELLCIGPVVSRSHLDFAIEGLYWTHVEQYPMHVRIPQGVLADLKCVLAHAQADHITSEVSTFPFSRKECAQFMKLLAGAEDHLDDGRIVCLIARLRQSIMTNRFWTHHGQDTARCSRDQSILEDADQDKEFTWLRRLSSPLTFGTSERYCKQLEDAFTDRLVYKDVWRKVVASNLNDWKRTSLHAYLALLFVNPWLLHCEN
jgi:hypothetical protein